ncbi:hypothetical protein LQE92_03840 [Lacrimispora sp. NSJ-141]|uniref:Periplasmic binding protein domain-containing protein n=1 Tax=Lientehia hominis TaxID=2897778 RepID=A0AAP2W870_9FIRM|nr:hypothetical protein [Lientehia hominis]MCD2491756.1 hypothetical protein [Lientehia hominis]
MNVRKSRRISACMAILALCFLLSGNEERIKNDSLALKGGRSAANEELGFRAGLCLTGDDEAVMTKFAPYLTACLEAKGITVITGSLEELKDEHADIIMASPMDKEKAEKIVKEVSEETPVLIFNHSPSDKIALAMMPPEGIYKAIYISYDYARIEEVLDELVVGGKKRFGKCAAVSGSGSTDDSLFLREIEKVCAEKGIDPEDVFVFVSDEEVSSLLETDSSVTHLFIELVEPAIESAAEFAAEIKEGKDSFSILYMEPPFVTREEYWELDR